MLLFKDVNNNNFLTTTNEYYTDENDFFKKNSFILRPIREIKNITQFQRGSPDEQLIVDNEIIVYNNNKYTYIKLIVLKHNVTLKSIKNYVLTNIIPRLNTDTDLYNLSAEIPLR